MSEQDVPEHVNVLTGVLLGPIMSWMTELARSVFEAIASSKKYTVEFPGIRPR